MGYRTGAKFALATSAASIVRNVRREVGTGPAFRKDITPVLLLYAVRYLSTYRAVSNSKTWVHSSVFICSNALIRVTLFASAASNDSFVICNPIFFRLNAAFVSLSVLTSTFKAAFCSSTAFWYILVLVDIAMIRQYVRARCLYTIHNKICTMRLYIEWAIPL